MRRNLVVEGTSPKDISSVKDLPKTIKDTLPADAEKTFLAALKTAVNAKPDEPAGVWFGMAWDAVNDSYKRGDDGEWVKKESTQSNQSMEIIESYVYEMAVIDKLVSGGHAMASAAKSVASSVTSFAKHAVETFRNKWQKFLSERRKLKYAEMLHDYITKVDKSLTARIAQGSEKFAAKVYADEGKVDISELAGLVARAAKDGVSGAAAYNDVDPEMFDIDVVEAVTGSLIFTVISYYGFEIKSA